MKLADVSIKRPVLATVMTAVLLVFGVNAYRTIGVDLMPDIEFPFAVITVVYPGADPETIETKVIEKLEEAVNTIEGIDMLRSTSMENVGMVMIQFVLERKTDQAVQDVRDKVAAVLSQLPPDLEPPVVQKFDPGSQPILAIAVASPRPIAELTDLADRQIKQKLETIAGVGGIDIIGGQEREFKVWVDPQKLEAFGLAVSDAVNTLRMQNIDVPGGNINTGRQELVVKTRGQVFSAADLGRLIITSAGGAPIRLADVATVEDGTEEKRSHSALNGQSAVALQLRKQSGANTVDVATKAKARLEELRAQLPPDVEVTIPTDNSIYIDQSISGVKEDLVLGGILAVIIILFFMRDWRATFIASLALPTSVIATFIFFKVFGFTFNVISMMGLSLSIGMLIDDAIVVIENIHRHLELGKPPLQAASEGVAEIGLAVMATTASIVAVFLPVATMSGIMGRFMWQFGITVTVAVLASLFVAFTLTPMLSSRMLKTHGGEQFRISRAIGWLLDQLTAGYRWLVAGALHNRVLVVVLALAFFGGGIYMATRVPMEFMPMEDQSAVKVLVELPTGTNLAATQEYVARIEGRLRASIPGIESLFTTIGGGSLPEVNKGEIQVNLVDPKDRGFTQLEAMTFIRKLLATEQGAARFSVDPAQGMGGGMRQSTVQFVLEGKDYEELNQGAQLLLAELTKLGGYVDTDISYRGGKPEVRVTIDRDRAADLGVPVAIIATTIRTFFAGEKASELAADGDRFDVRVQLPDDGRRDPEAILQLKVRSTTGLLVPLSSFVTLEQGTGPAKMERQDRSRQVTILANLEGKALGEAQEEINRLAKQHLEPRGLHGLWSGQAKMMEDSIENMKVALILAVIMIFLILAAQFESFLHPFTIMLSLPLSLVGAFGMLLASGHTMSIFGWIGIIMLMGLVTKNAILLVDYTNTLREQGVARREALIRAGAVRLRPILMTTLAMIFGMLPIALALSPGSESRAPMALAVIGGLITSTLLTLVVVPTMYDLLDGAREKLLGRGTAGDGAGGAATGGSVSLAKE